MDAHSLRSFPAFKTLEIVKFDTDAGFYLMSIPESGPIADSWHQSLEDAKHQAESDFGVTNNEWIEANKEF